MRIVTLESWKRSKTSTKGKWEWENVKLPDFSSPVNEKLAKQPLSVYAHYNRNYVPTSTSRDPEG